VSTTSATSAMNAGLAFWQVGFSSVLFDYTGVVPGTGR
jgi:hypothetical protein